MKKIIYTLFVLIFFSCSIENKKNSLEEEKIFGKAKSIREISYVAHDKFGKVSKGEIKGDILHQDFLKKFNNNGNNIETIIYSSDGSLYEKYINKFDEKGNEIEKNIYDSNNILKWKYLIKFDDKGNMTEKNYYNSDGNLNSKETNKYDDKGNKIEENYYGIEQISGSESFSTRWTFKHNDQNKSTEWYYHIPGNEPLLNYIYKYDDNGNQIEWSGYNLGIPNFKTYANYDINGNLLELKSYETNERLISHEYHKYQFDKNENWIQRIDYVDEVPKFIIQREIEYYN
ncbi:hypothetical protein CXF59_01095 [Flavobacterium sp. ALD4]|uniref:hypothetical protein n=1 Tax=Flavobacterium sp. ALD4 TaxID=2058314 RepID=UPI000C34B484|nr:hypothetical protein [Flavobacterium sp. ALD4]PKH68903.1 hypothetical protein CXF59_01095 [Flavobacterium sp. ALD4]